MCCDNSLRFQFVYPWLLVRLNIFKHDNWSFGYSLWYSACWSLLPTFLRGFFSFWPESCLYTLEMSPLCCKSLFLLWRAFVPLSIDVYHGIFKCIDILIFNTIVFFFFFLSFFLVSGFCILLKKSFISLGHEDSLQHCLLILNCCSHLGLYKWKLIKMK